MVLERVALLAWYDSVRRDLPWRSSNAPYPIWISEIMLQQTTVSVVLPYFERFLAAFPRLEDLAASPLERVLALWSGLGYYRRARQMHQAARALVARGGFPTNTAELQTLPGIGPYTAAAIASIAFGENVAVVDGNVVRVIARRLAFAGDVDKSSSRRLIQDEAALLLDPARPGDSNQALMELGATLCRPTKPLCPRCPLATGCRGRDDAENLPRRKDKQPKVDLKLAIAKVERQGELLFFRRPDSETLMAGLWELPTVSSSADLEAAFARRYGGRFTIGARLGTCRHTITFRRLKVEIFAAEIEVEADTIAQGPPALWLAKEQLDQIALSSLARKVLAATTAETST